MNAAWQRARNRRGALARRTSRTESKLPSWYVAYVGLALLNFLTLALSFGLNYRQDRLLTESSARYRAQLAVLDRLNVVGNSALAVSIASNAVFSSRDVGAVLRDLDGTTAQFTNQLAQLRADLDRLLTADARARIESQVREVESDCAELQLESKRMLTAFAAGNVSETGRYAAAKAQVFARLIAKLMLTAHSIRETQLNIVIAQREHAHEAYRLGIWLLLGAALVTVIVVLHAHHVLRAVRKERMRRGRYLEALTRARDRAEYETRVKSQFLANMSHEIRTPMNGVLGMLDALQATPLTADQGKLLRAANAAADLLLGVVGDVLDFSKIDAGMLVVESAPVDLKQIVLHIHSLYSARASEKALALRLNVPERLPHVASDAARLTQILSNLVSNAIKFTDAGEVTLGVQVEEENESRARIGFAVTDTGIGIGAADRERLFAPFMQADASTNRRYGGTGLGLAICRQLVRLLDPSGHIDVRSEVGRGSEFSFVLELKKVAAGSDGAADTFVRDNSSARRLRGRVLVAEDNEINRQVAVALLRNLGLQTGIAENGRAAVAAARDGAFDLILMDYHMPLLDGCDAAAEIRRHERESGSARTPIVAVTASVLKEDKDRCIASGMDDFLAKPIRQRVLAEMLGKWLPAATTDAEEDAQQVDAGSRNVANELREHFDVAQWLEMRTISGEGFPGLIEQFHLSAREAFDTLRAAVESRDADQLRRAAHKFKGAAGALGAITLAEHCRVLESIGQERRIVDARERLAALEQEYLVVRRYMDTCAMDVAAPAALP